MIVCPGQGLAEEGRARWQGAGIKHGRLKAGDEVLVTGQGLGETIWGGYSQLARLLADALMGREMPRVRSKYTNPFCTILARTNKICGECLEVQRKLSSTNTADTQTVTCFVGLTTTSVPVKLEARVIAFLQTGQVFLRTPSAKRLACLKHLPSSGLPLGLHRVSRSRLRVQST